MINKFLHLKFQSAGGRIRAAVIPSELSAVAKFAIWKHELPNNYVRILKPPVPIFNNNSLWKNEVTHYLNQLKKIALPNINVKVAKNQLFSGLGYQATFIQENFRHTLILPTYIKKVFMDELTGEVFPLVMTELKESLKYTFATNAAYFSRRRTDRRQIRKTDLLTSTLDKNITNINCIQI